MSTKYVPVSYSNLQTGYMSLLKLTFIQFWQINWKLFVT